MHCMATGWFLLTGVGLLANCRVVLGTWPPLAMNVVCSGQLIIIIIINSVDEALMSCKFSIKHYFLMYRIPFLLIYYCWYLLSAVKKMKESVTLIETQQLILQGYVSNLFLANFMWQFWWWGLYLVNKTPLAAGISEDNAQGWKISKKWIVTVGQEVKLWGQQLLWNFGDNLSADGICPSIH